MYINCTFTLKRVLRAKYREVSTSTIITILHGFQLLCSSPQVPITHHSGPGTLRDRRVLAPLPSVPFTKFSKTPLSHCTSRRAYRFSRFNGPYAWGQRLHFCTIKLIFVDKTTVASVAATGCSASRVVCSLPCSIGFVDYNARHCYRRAAHRKFSVHC